MCRVPVANQRVGRFAMFVADGRQRRMRREEDGQGREGAGLGAKRRREEESGSSSSLGQTFAFTTPVFEEARSTRVLRRYQVLVLIEKGTECRNLSKFETTSSFWLFPTRTKIYLWLISPTFDLILRSMRCVQFAALMQQKSWKIHCVQRCSVVQPGAHLQIEPFHPFHEEDRKWIGGSKK